MELIVEQVSKRHAGDRWALRDLSLELRGGLLALLGSNGAGKSTLMRILATISRPTSGRVLWNGVDIADNPNALRVVLGYLHQSFGVYPNLTAAEFLEYMAAIKGLDRLGTRRRIQELLRVLNLSDHATRRLEEYSQGMRQRVGIAVALLNDPRVLIMDEPSVGLDPQERISLRNLLAELANDRIVLLSTHIVQDVEHLAADLAILSEGRLVSRISPEALLKSAAGFVWEWDVPPANIEALRQGHILTSLVRSRDSVRVRAISPQCPAEQALLVQPTLEDAYLHCVSTLKPGYAA